MKACVYCLFFFLLNIRHDTIWTHVHFNTIQLALMLDMCLNHIMSNVKNHWGLYLITKSQLFQFNTFECECQLQRCQFLLWFLWRFLPPLMPPNNCLLNGRYQVLYGFRIYLLGWELGLPFTLPPLIFLSVVYLCL